MGFRDDREASAQRLEALERELARTKDELEAATLRAAEVDDLRRRVLRGVDPRWETRARTLAAGCVLVVVGSVVALTISHNASERDAMDRRRERELAESRFDAREAELSAARETVAATRAQCGDREQERDDEIARLRRQLGASSPEDATALVVTARITDQSGGEAAAGSACALVFRDGPGLSCIATLTCGATQVFPGASARHEVPAVQCVGDDGVSWRAESGVRVSRARSANTDPGAPTLSFDANTRTIEVRGPVEAPSRITLRVEGSYPVRL